MFKLKENSKPSIILGIALLLLIAISYVPEGIKIAGYEVKAIDLFSDIRPDEPLSINFNNDTKLYAGALNADLLNNILSGGEAPADATYFEMTPSPAAYVGLSGNVGQMSYFFQALKQSRNKKVRIAHFGDSAIEGDNITSDFRQNLQNEFGGQGAGFLTITSQDINFRLTTKHSFSNNWKVGSVIAGNPDKLPMGFSGFVFTPQGASTVTYQCTDRLKSTKNFKYARLFYSDAKNSSIKYSINNQADQSISITPGSGVKELLLKANGEGKSVKITTTMANQANFYGVSLESDNGVYVDNLPLRGNSGVGLKEISNNVFADFNKLLDYKLIILNFGLNVASSEMKDYTWYENDMIKIIGNLKKAFPQTSILIIGVGDKSFKKGTKFITDPGVLKLIQSQKTIADKAGVAFWNLFEAMGGNNSMESWANSNPPLAQKDYTHLTLEGAKKTAEMLSKALVDEFRKSK